MKVPFTVPFISAIRPAGKLVQVQIYGNLPLSASNRIQTIFPTIQVRFPFGLDTTKVRRPMAEPASTEAESTTLRIKFWLLLIFPDLNDTLTGKDPCIDGLPSMVPLGYPVKAEGRLQKSNRGASRPPTLNCTVQKSPTKAVGGIGGLRKYVSRLFSLLLVLAVQMKSKRSAIVRYTSIILLLKTSS